MKQEIIRARVEQSFKGQPDDQTAPRTIAAGEIISGDLARVAIEQKWAVPLKAAPAPKSVRAKRSRGKKA